MTARTRPGDPDEYSGIRACAEGLKIVSCRVNGVECAAEAAKTDKPTIPTRMKPTNAMELAREARGYLESECNLDGEERSREVVLTPKAKGEKIRCVPIASDGDGAQENGGGEIEIEIEYETDASNAGIVADASYFSCPGPSRRPACWFPCVERGDVLTTFEFEVTAPRYLQVITSAHWDKVERCEDETEDEDGFRHRHFFSGLYPTFAHEMRIIVGRFVAVSSPIKGITLFAPKDGEFEEKLEVAARGVGKAITTFEEYLGHPYPISCLNVVFMPASYVGSRENQGACINIHRTSWLVDAALNSALLESRIHIATAIARQWFGGVVVPADTTDSWVVEGLAQYLAGEYIKSLAGMNELAFRRMKEMRLTTSMDDGQTMPPLASRAARIWRGGQYAGPDHAAGGAPKPLSASVERALQSKAVTIVYMLEKRLGPDVLQKVMKYFGGLHVRIKRDKKDQATRAGPSAEVLASNARWIHTVQLFDHCRSTVNLGKGEVNSFLERWVYGAGVPKLSVGYVVKRRKNVMEFAVKLEGSEAAAAADRAALAVARNHRTSVTVRMREENRADANDHVVSLGQSAWQLMEIPLQPKQKDRRPKTIIESGGDPELIAAMDCPVRYVRVDPEFEWMANIEQSVAQIGMESMMAHMLENEKDVVAQAIAVDFLGRRVSHGSMSAVLVLDKCLNSEDTFCRVRAEAALALGKSASAKTQWGGLQALIRHYKKYQCDEATGKPKRNDFRDLAKVIVDQAVIDGLSRVFDAEQNATHPDALEVLVDRLKRNDNEGNPQLDDDFVSTCIAALGRCTPADANTCIQMLEQLHDYINRDLRFPSEGYRITTAAIQSMGNLVARIDSPELREDAANIAQVGFDLGVQTCILAAAETMMHVKFAEAKSEVEALDYILKCSSEQTSATHSAMLWRVCEYLQAFRNSDSLKAVRPDTLAQLRDRVLNGGSEIASAAFYILWTLTACDKSLDEVCESIAEAIKRAGEQIPVGIDVHAGHAPRTAEEEARRAEKEAKRARKRERERARQMAREAAEQQAMQQRRLDAEAAFVEETAAHIEDSKTISERTAAITGDAGAPDTPATGLKRGRNDESVKSFVETATAAPPAEPAPAPKKLKLSFKLKKPTV